MTSETTKKFLHMRQPGGPKGAPWLGAARGPRRVPLAITRAKKFSIMPFSNNLSIRLWPWVNLLLAEDWLFFSLLRSTAWSEDKFWAPSWLSESDRVNSFVGLSLDDLNGGIECGKCWNFWSGGSSMGHVNFSCESDTPASYYKSTIAIV